jgi:hypothetical protein
MPWCEIHDFVSGWGMCLFNEETEDYEKSIFFTEVHWCFGKDISEFEGEKDDAFWDDLHKQMAPLLAQRARDLQEHNEKHPLRFDKINIPKIEGVTKWPSIKDIFGK